MKERILDTAKEKFINVGYVTFNMDDLCRDLGISKKTLYEYYPSKKDLFKQCAIEFFAEIKSETHEVLELMIKDEKFLFFDHLKQMYEVVNKHHKKLKSNFLTDIKRYAPEAWKCSHDFEVERRFYFDKIWELGVKEGKIKSNINKNVYYIMYFGTLHSVLNPDILADLSISSFQALEQLYNVLMTGILTEDGVKDFNEKIN